MSSCHWETCEEIDFFEAIRRGYKIRYIRGFLKRKHFERVDKKAVAEHLINYLKTHGVEHDKAVLIPALHDSIGEIEQGQQVLLDAPAAPGNS